MIKIPLKLYLCFFLLILLIFLVLLPKLTPTVKVLPHSNDAVIEKKLTDVYCQRFDKQGFLAQELYIQSWENEKGETQSHLNYPVLKVYPKDGSLWEIKAQDGLIYQTQILSKIEKLQLYHHVQITRLNQPEDPGLKLETESLFFYPYQRYAETSLPVVVIGNGMEIHGQGLRVNFENQTIEFLKNVSSHYAKPNA